MRQQTPGAQWLVGGDVAINLDYDQHLSDRLPWVVAFVVGLTMLIMVVALRSIVLAVLTAFMNLLSAGAAFGVLVLVFQHSWFEGLLGFQSTGAIINWIPLFTFAVLFGLSMDYHIFLLSRIREAARSGLPMTDAVRAGVVSSAGTITSAAIVMVSVFAIFASLHMIEMKELGVGLGRGRADRRGRGPDGAAALGAGPARALRLVAGPAQPADRVGRRRRLSRRRWWTRAEVRFTA